MQQEILPEMNMNMNMSESRGKKNKTGQNEGRATKGQTIELLENHLPCVGEEGILDRSGQREVLSGMWGH